MPSPFIPTRAPVPAAPPVTLNPPGNVSVGVEPTNVATGFPAVPGLNVHIGDAFHSAIVVVDPAYIFEYTSGRNLYRVDDVIADVFVDVTVIVPPFGVVSVICADRDAGNSLVFRE